MPFSVDVDEFEGDLWVGQRGVELHEREGAGLAVAPDESLGLHDAMGMPIGQAGAFELAEGVASLVWNGPQIRAVAIGRNEEDALDLLVADP